MHPWLFRMVRQVRAVFRHQALDNELDAEMRLHIELEAEDIARTRGLPHAEAYRQAVVSFGGVADFKEAHRDARGLRWLRDSLQDIRYSARSLRRSAGFTLSSVLILALGIGATTAVFSAVNAVLRDPDYDRLTVIFQQRSSSDRGTLSTVDFRAIEEQQRSFRDVGALRWGEAAFAAGGEPTRVRRGAATSGFFRAFGLRAVRGRLLEPGDEPVGAPPVAVVSLSRARSDLGGENVAVGRAVTVDGVAHTVVGVLPGDVTELAGIRADVWTALQLPTPTRRGPFGIRVVGRLRDGVTLDAASRDLAGISDRVFALWSAGSRDTTARLTPVLMRTAILGDASKMLGMFAAAVGLVLLIAVANVGSLMLVRAIARGQEVALRSALGASRARLVRLMVTESCTLAAVGAAAGVVMGALALRALVAFGPRMPRLATAHLDWRAVTFAVLVAVSAGAIVGAYPIVLLFRYGITGAGQGGDRTIGAGRGTQAMRSGFVVAQFALALPLLAVAGLLLNSFVRLQHVDPGFDPQNILSVRVSLPAAYRSDSVIAAFWSRTLPLIRDMPGVSGVGVGGSMPPDDGGDSNNDFVLIDRPVAPGEGSPTSPWPIVSRDYFGALGVPLIEGRLFAPADTGGPAPVVLVSRSWAQRYFPDGSAVGRTLISGGCNECPRTTVVGVVGDVHYVGLDGTLDAVYGPVTEGWPRDLNLFIRTAGSPGSAAARVRAVLRSVDANVPLDDVAPMEDRLYASVAQPRNWSVLIGAFAASALVLAAVGIFGMLSYSVSTRQREIGVRMALGAHRSAVVSMIVRRGIGHAVAGSALGLVAALAGTRTMGTSLFAVSASDPMTLAGVTLLLLFVAWLACWIPARRAAAIDPVQAIRVD